MTKQVKISKNVHEKLLYLKHKNNAKSINDVICSLIKISEEYYTNDGTINLKNKDFKIKYSNGRIVEIEFRAKR